MKRAITSVLLAMLLLGGLALLNRARASAGAAAPVSQSVEPLFAMLPDSDLVVSVNVAQLNRQLQGLVADKAELAAELQKHLDRLVADTGVDIRSIDTVAIGLSLGGTNKKTDPVILASGRFNESEILTSIGRTSKKQFKTETYKGARIHSEHSGKSGREVVSFLDENTVVFGSPESVRRSIDTRSGNQPSAAQNSALMSALAQASSSASIRFAVTVPEVLRQRITGSSELGGMLKPLVSVNQVIGSVDLGDNGLLANISLVTPSEKEAGDIVSLITNGLAFVRLAIGSSPEGQKFASVLNGITNAQVGNSANVTVTVPADLIRELLEQIQPKKAKS